jgi:FkbM family methyltransferase
MSLNIGNFALDLRYKLNRVLRWGKRIGLINAIAFEFQQSLGRPLVSFTHRGLNRKIYLRSSSSDVSILEHVFIEDEFDIELKSPKFIIDGGANCGLAALYLACRYPNAQILAVEPSAENCELCFLNTAGLNVEVSKSAIWSSSTTLKIENPRDEPWAFQCVEADEGDEGSFWAEDMQSLLSGKHCDLLKLDIEGAELELFKNPSWLKDVSVIVVEVHGDDADELIRSSCKGWSISRTGEKLLLARETNA